MSDTGNVAIPGTQPVAAAPVGSAPAGVNGATAPWYSTLDEVTRGTIQNTGLDKLDPVAAVGQAVKMFRDTQSKLGIPADRVLRLPAEPTDEAGWKAVHQRLGVPDSADGYDFSTVKNADGSEIAADLVSFLRSTAAELRLPKDTAPRLASALVKLAADGEAQEASAQAIQNGEARLRLQQNWGPNAPGNTFVAQRTAAMLGLPPELMATIEASPQYDTIMEGLRVAGERMGEAQLIGAGGGPSGQNRISTKEQAQARIEELIRDRDFATRRLTPGEPGRAAREEWAHLHRMMVSGA